MLELFQKGSPYLSDANHLWQLSEEMGLKFTDYARNIEEYVQNATKCDKWTDVKASHKNKDHIVVLNYDDIYGLLIILAIGLTGSLIIFIAEYIMNKMMNRQTQ